MPGSIKFLFFLENNAGVFIAWVISLFAVQISGEGEPSMPESP
jgi:hypothetical protein